MPVDLNHSQGLSAVNLAIAYDPTRLNVSAADVQRGTLTSDFDSFAVTVDQQAGIIRYSRGQIEILDAEALQSTACECYRIVKAKHEHLLKVLH